MPGQRRALKKSRNSGRKQRDCIRVWLPNLPIRKRTVHHTLRRNNHHTAGFQPVCAATPIALRVVVVIASCFLSAAYAEDAKPGDVPWDVIERWAAGDASKPPVKVEDAKAAAILPNGKP